MRNARNSNPFRKRRWPGRCYRHFSLVALCGLAMVLIPAIVLAQTPNSSKTAPTRQPFTRGEIVELLQMNTPEALLIARVQSAGVDFIATQEDLTRFSDLGASNTLLNVIRTASEQLRAKNVAGTKSSTASPIQSMDQRLAPAEGSLVHDATEAPSSPPQVRGMVKTAFSLRFIDIATGSGPEAEPNKMYKMHYTIWLAADGRKVDSSYDHRRPLLDSAGKPLLNADGKPQSGDPQPISIPQGMGRVIPGLDQGLSGMRIGGKRRLFIPWQLAYGVRGRPSPKPDSQGIPPQADLIVDVELIAVTELPLASEHKPN